MDVMGKNDREIVDQWFNNICAGVASGIFEQEIADPSKRGVIQKNLENDKDME